MVNVAEKVDRHLVNVAKKVSEHLVNVAKKVSKHLVNAVEKVGKHLVNAVEKTTTREVGQCTFPGHSSLHLLTQNSRAGHYPPLLQH